MAKRQVNVVVKARDEASRKLLKIGGAAGSMGAAIRKAALAGAAFFGARAIFRQGQDIVDIMIEQDKANKKLAQSLIATGHAAGFTAEELGKYASELQDATTFGDDAIKTAQSILATFKNIKGEIFKETVLAGLDVATALDQTTSLKEIFVQLGKALNDPIIGITALTRTGISFSDQQKEQIKNLVKANRVMEAQKIIIAEVNAQFGGQAKAAAQGTGIIAQMRNEIDELKKEIGAELMPVILDSARGIRDWARDNKVSIGDWTRVAVNGAVLVKDVFMELGKFMRDDWRQFFQFGLDATLVGVEVWGRSLIVIFGKIFDDLQTFTGIRFKNIALDLFDLADLTTGLIFRDPKLIKHVLERGEARGDVNDQLERITTPWTEIFQEIKDIHAEGFKDLVDKTPPTLAAGIAEAFAKFQGRLAGLGLPPGAGGALPPGSPAAAAAAAAARSGRGGLRPFESRFLGTAPSTTRRDPVVELVKINREQLDLQKRQKIVNDRFVAKALTAIGFLKAPQETDFR